MQPSNQKVRQRKPICNPPRQTHRQAHWSHFPQGTGKLSRVTEGWEQSKVGGEIPGSVPYYFINEMYTDRGSDRENSRGTTAVTESKHKCDCLIGKQADTLCITLNTGWSGHRSVFLMDPSSSRWDFPHCVTPSSWLCDTPQLWIIFSENATTWDSGCHKKIVREDICVTAYLFLLVYV